MNSQKRIVTVAFKKNFLTKIEDMHTEFKKILYSRVLNLYKKKNIECIKQQHNPRYHCIRQKRKPAKFHGC